MTRRLCPLWIFLLAWICVGPLASGAELVAEQITEASAKALRVGGSGAVGGIGDWALGNGTLCAVISDVSRESILSVRGGELIDLGLCGRHDDQWPVLESLFNFSRNKVLPAEQIQAEIGAGQARILASGEHLGIRFTTSFILDDARPRELQITTRLTRTHQGERLFLFGDVSLHGHRSLTAFTTLSSDPSRAIGFDHPPVNTNSKLAMVRAIVPADLHVLVGGDAIEPGIAYGVWLRAANLERANGEAEALPSVAINGESFSILGVLTNPLWVGREEAIGLLELTQTLFMDLAIDESLVFERTIIVGERADVASVTDAVFANGPLVRGHVDDPRARLHISSRSGGPLTEVRPEPDGSFAFRVPVQTQEIELELRAPGRLAKRQHLRLDGPETDLGLLSTDPPARLTLPRGAPMRLVFIGIEGTPNPRFGDDLLDFRVGGKAIPSSRLTNSISLAGIQADLRDVVLPPGRYRVLATRGPEYDISETELTAVAGETVGLQIEPPKRELTTPGWITADLHVHTEHSFDSTLPLDERLIAFAAQGGELLVATEHDRIIDYAPAIARLGLTERLRSIIGVEVTGTVQSEVAPRTIGHANAFPMPLNPLAHRGGAPAGEGRRLRQVIAQVRALGGERIFQLNHPRSPTDEQGNMFYLDHLSQGVAYDPSQPLGAEGNRLLIEADTTSGLRDLDFDAIEILNGSGSLAYERTREDWFSLLRQGEIKTATANSDSHSAGEIVALPRTYVTVPEDSVAGFDEAEFVRALREGRAFGTTGPLVSVRLGDAGLGDTFHGTEGVLKVEVRAAGWVPISEVRVFVNGEVVEERAARAGQRLEIPLHFKGDAFVTVEVLGEADAIYSEIAPNFTPLAFTNPIFVDVEL